MFRTAIGMVMLLTAAGTATRAAAEESPAADYVQFFQFFEGAWKLQVGTSTGTWKFEMSPTRQWMQSYLSVDGRGLVSSLEGYDARSGNWKRTFMGANGLNATVLIAVDPARLRQSPVGVTFQAKSRLVGPNGEEQMQVNTWTVLTRDKCEIRLGDGPLMTLERVPATP